MLLLPLLGVIGLLTLVLVVWLSARPLNRVKRWGDLGYFLKKDAGDRYRAWQLERLKRMRLKGELPPVYPNGWYCVEESRQLKKGEIQPVVLFGRQLALVRTLSGSAHLLDSYCPHLGANFTVGGKVIADSCIQCPFHGWVFSAETGACVRVPYDEGRVPDQAKVRTYTVVEKNAHIYVWFHCDDDPPAWDLPDIDEIANGEWSFKGRTEHEVMCHVQEIPENGADIAHLGFLHNAAVNEGHNIFHIALHDPHPLLRHEWQGSWKTSEDESHVGIMTLKQVIMWRNWKLPLTSSHLEAHQIGPGVVYMHFDFGWLGRGVVLHHVTPEEPLLQRARFVMYGNLNPIFARFFLTSEALQFERDIYIWSNKKYLRSPLLVRNDGPIQRHRRWFGQFYTENSPKLRIDGTVTSFWGSADEDDGSVIEW